MGRAREIEQKGKKEERDKKAKQNKTYKIIFSAKHLPRYCVCILTV